MKAAAKGGWISPDNDQQLRRLAEQGLDWALIAERLGAANRGAVRHRARRLGLIKPPAPVTGGWPEADVALVRRLWLGGSSAGEIAARLPGRTRNAVIGKLNRLGLMGEGSRNAPGPECTPPRVVRTAPPPPVAPPPQPVPPPPPPRPRAGASEAELIAAALAEGRVTLCPPQAACGLSSLERQFWPAPPEGSNVTDREG